MSMIPKYELHCFMLKSNHLHTSKMKNSSFNSGSIVTGPQQTAVKNLELEVENTCNSRLDYGHEF